MEPYRTLYPESRRYLRVTERVADRVIVLPTGLGISEDEIAGVCKVLELSLASLSEMKSRPATSMRR